MISSSRLYRLRVLLKWLLQTRFMRYTVLVLIIFNAITLGMETNTGVMAQYGNLLVIIDHSVIIFFVIEIFLRIIGSGVRNFFRDRWNIFDFAVICLSIIPPHASEFSILRTFRILRILRILSAVPAIRRVVNGLIASLSSVLAVAMMLLIVFYTFAVMATLLFHTYSEESFGSIKRSMLTLWPIMTLSEWPEIVRHITTTYDYCWIFFIGFVIITNYTMLNLLAGIIVNTMNKVVHIDESTYQGIDRRKRYSRLPGTAERRNSKMMDANLPSTQMQLLNTEEHILAQIQELRQNMEEIKMALGNRPL